MKKTQVNVEKIIVNVLLKELPDSSLLTPERVNQIAGYYLQTGDVLLPDSVLGVSVNYPDGTLPPGFEPLQRALYQEFERYSLSDKKAFENAAEVIIVKVLGLELETFVDANGTQRFKTDTVVLHLFDKGVVDLDSLSRDFHNGKMSTEDFLTFYAKSGYSVGGLASLSHFSHLDFDNPLWSSI